MQGFTYLKTKLELKRPRVQTRYKYYEQKQKVRDFQISTPPSLWGWMSTLGWCSKAVDALADRLQFYEFRDDNFDMNSIFELNNADILYDSAILSALISSCCFIYIRADENGYPRLQVLDGGRATGIMDPITGMLEEGYAVLEEDEIRDRVDMILFAKLLLLVHIDLHECDLSVIFLRELLDERADHAARAAPRCPEIHQNGEFAVDDGIKVILCACDDVCHVVAPFFY